MSGAGVTAPPAPQTERTAGDDVAVLSAPHTGRTVDGGVAVLPVPHTGRPAGDGAVPSVLHVAQPVDGGVAVYVAAVAADQARRGWNVAVACPGRGRLPADLDALGVRWLEWEAGRSPGPCCPGEARRLRRLADGFGPHVVHLHSSKAGLAGRAAIRGTVPTLFQPHGWSWLASHGAMAGAALAWERTAARWTGLTVCVSEGEAALARDRGLRGNLTVVRNGVDLDRFRPADAAGKARAREALGVSADDPLVVCVGRVTRQKGQDVLVAAWEEVARRCPRARLAIVGDGDLRPALRTGPGVLFTGAVDDARPWYAAADLVVLPSRWEGLPLTALEAMACGRSLVASGIPGLREVVTGETGALVPPDDDQALAEALVRRLLHPELARREGEAGSARAAGFGLRDALDRLAALTSRAAGIGGTPGPGVGCGGAAGSVFGRGGSSGAGGFSADSSRDSSGDFSRGFSGDFSRDSSGDGASDPPDGGTGESSPVTGAGDSGGTESPVTGGVPESADDGTGEPSPEDGAGDPSGDTMAGSRLRKTREDRGLDGHCQTPCGQ
ncbi:glycosyltransferase [Planobispora siamensis]|uniref:Glycosyltransferase subfamily 4-like N-terminal domain-containing protein n=1 Tax=Planobispora siamensis TaxID=936338 RepID=A0A8J3SHG8_9ACTN|nr:glycosyltransferase [Planobispora siamensis]GIH89773.1 hypothetical protein Psi01_04030 [Planobispora siamensis]